MELIDINKEIVRIADSLSFTSIDDAEYLNQHALWIEQLYKSKGTGNKINDYKSVFYASLNLYDLSANKSRLYEKANVFSNKMINEFLKDKEGYEIKVEKRKEEIRKVSADTGKLYEYAFTFIITVYQIKGL